MSKAFALTAAVLAGLALSGCAALVGGGVGAAGSAGGYEYHLNQEKQRVENDYKAGRIGQTEYQTRIDQIKRDSIFQ